MGLIGKLMSACLKKEKRPFCSAIVVAAGQSTRMHGENKIFSDLYGMPVIAHTLSAIQASEYIDEIVVVTREENIVAVADICAANNISKTTKIVCGGAERADSVLIGTVEASPKAELLAIHDAARPLVTQNVIADVVLAAARFGAAITAIPVHDTLKKIKNGVVVETIDRSEVFSVQTPQVFRADLLKAALHNAKKNKINITDDSMAAEAIGITVHVTSGSFENIKITTPEDLFVAETIIIKRNSI